MPEQRPEYLSLGIQYYIAGRHAFFCRLFPVVGSLFHDAVEMLLYEGLVRHHDYDLVRRTNKSKPHSIPILWADFKRARSLNPPQRYDRLVLGLHEWDRLRFLDPQLRRSPWLREPNGDKARRPRRTRSNGESEGVTLDDLDEFLTSLLVQLTDTETGDEVRGLLMGEGPATYLRQNNYRLV